MCDAVTPEATMTDLRLVAVTPERSHLVLEDSGSRQFRVPVDERLAAALRTPDRSRPGQLEIALESQLSPREVLAERAHVVEQAQKAPARRATAGSAPALAELVSARLAEQKVAPDSVSWDAWRGDDDRWTVRLGYLGTGRAREATWTFDPRGRVLAPADDEARWLVDGSGADRVDEDAPAAVRRLAAVPRAADEPSGPRSPADEVYDREADEAPAAMPSAAPMPAEPVEPARHAASASRGRRQPVPSWDDIMFGPRKRD
jgi:hypothetical protein